VDVTATALACMVTADAVVTDAVINDMVITDAVAADAFVADTSIAAAGERQPCATARASSWTSSASLSRHPEPEGVEGKSGLWKERRHSDIPRPKEEDKEGEDRIPAEIESWVGSWGWGDGEESSRLNQNADRCGGLLRFAEGVDGWW
jgi:hypothetical protein